MIWFTSDLHLFHDRPFIYEERGFKNVYEMNKAIVDNWNRVVSFDDDVYILGDLMLNNNEDGIKLIKSLKGNIHIVLGNHDTENRKVLYEKCWNVKEVVYATVLKYEGYSFYLSHYPTLCNHDDKPPKKDIINLFGHTHQKEKFLNNNCKMYNVGVDAHNCTPISIEEIINDIKNAWLAKDSSTCSKYEH